MLGQSTDFRMPNSEWFSGERRQWTGQALPTAGGSLGSTKPGTLRFRYGFYDSFICPGAPMRSVFLGLAWSGSAVFMEPAHKAERAA